MNKRLISIVLSALMVLSMFCISFGTVSADVTSLPEPAADTNRYYFYAPEQWFNEYAKAAGSNIGIYWWDGEGIAPDWPGIPANKADFEGVYYYDVPKDVTTIMWTNMVDGGYDYKAPECYFAMQTPTIPTEWYDPFESDFYPDGVESFDNMIYVLDYSYYPYGDYSNKLIGTGEWFYYYGNGEYGIAPKKGDSSIITGSTTLLEDVLENNYPGMLWESPTTPYYYGDANSDYTVNVKDATAIQKNLAGLEWFDATQREAADVDANYNLNIKDATAIQKWVAGMNTGTYKDEWFGRFWC